MGLTTERHALAGLMVFDGPELIAEIRALRLIHARFRAGGDSFLTEEVPLPLFWMQYADHEDPERNAGSNAQIRVLHSDPERITLECDGTTASGACASRVTLTITRDAQPVRYRYGISARLEVVSGTGWTVTPNPNHGEVEFANLWPDGTFVKNRAGRKLYQSCIVAGRNGALRIPHHHLASADKNNIPVVPGDRFFWGIEDENPCLLLEAGENVSAGVCAYMWDAHFAFKVTAGAEPVVLEQGTRFDAKYSLSVLDRAAAESLSSDAMNRPSPVPGPVYVDGVNRFSETLESVGMEEGGVWPWEKEGSGDDLLSHDRARGFDDFFSLRIRRNGKGKSAWKATAFGPDYGKEPFRDGARYRLTARVMTRAVRGYATIALRLHRQGHADLFQIEKYEMVASSRSVNGSSDWESLEAITPPITPPPDRLHLLLVQEGEGESWFDNVLLEVF